MNLGDLKVRLNELTPAPRAEAFQFEERDVTVRIGEEDFSLESVSVEGHNLVIEAGEEIIPEVLKPKFRVVIDESSDLVELVGDAGKIADLSTGRYVELRIMYGDEEVFKMESARPWVMMPQRLLEFEELLRKAQGDGVPQ